jgi:hypothetical protein
MRQARLGKHNLVDSSTQVRRYVQQGLFLLLTSARSPLLAGKLARPVRRGGSGGDAALLPEVSNCRSIAVERQIATYWPEGDNKIYPSVSPDTFLSAC